MFATVAPSNAKFWLLNNKISTVSPTLSCDLSISSVFKVIVDELRLNESISNLLLVL